MKKYYYEAQKKQLEKESEPFYICCSKTRCWVIAEDEAEAEKLAYAELRAKNHATGAVFGKLVMTKCVELPVDWSYGYGENRKSGCTACVGDLVGNDVIR